MAVVSVGETWIEGREGRITDENSRSYRKTFIVVVDSVNDDSITVQQATGIPAMFAVWTSRDGTEIDLGSVVREISSNQDPDNPLRWTVEVLYDSIHAREEEYTDNPLDRPADWEMSFVQFQRVADKGYRVTAVDPDTGEETVEADETAITNSSGEVYDPPAEKDDSRPVLIVTKNQATFDPALAVEYQDAVNDDYFFGAAPGLAKMQSIRAVHAFENNVDFYRVTYEVHFRREGWNLKLLDQGFHELVAGELVAIVDDNGVVANNPRLLNGAGLKNPNGDPPQFRTYRIYERKKFKELGIL